jgi:hypothetical protein
MVGKEGHVLHAPVVFAQRWEAGESFLGGLHGVTEDHNETTNNREVAQEKVEIEDESVAESLNDYYA